MDVGLSFFLSKSISTYFCQPILMNPRLLNIFHFSGHDKDCLGNSIKRCFTAGLVLYFSGEKKDKSKMFAEPQDW